MFGGKEIKVIPFEEEAVTRMKEAAHWVKLKFLMKMEQLFVGQERDSSGWMIFLSYGGSYFV